MKYRTASSEDLPAILKLYKAVAKVKGGLAREEDEITEEYVKEFLDRSQETGILIVAEHPENPEELIGAIHAYKKGLKVFNHVLGDLTIVVHPDHQGKKIGKTLFMIFLEEVAVYDHDIGRVELMVRESNIKAIQFYKSLGFKIEGRLEMRIKTPEGKYEADIPMSWQNPNFEF